MPCDIVLKCVRLTALCGCLAFAGQALAEVTVLREEGESWVIAREAAELDDVPRKQSVVTRRYQIREDPQSGRLVRVARIAGRSERIVKARADAAGLGRTVVQGGSADTEPQKGSGKVDLDVLIRRLSERYELAPELVRAVIRQESAFDPFAVSVKGAQGLMQLMPETARRFGVQDVFDPAENVLGGVKYLRVLLDRYEGDTRLALAAYNAGEGAVDRYKGVPPYAETRDYVKRITGNERSVDEIVAVSGETKPAEMAGSAQRITSTLGDDGSIRFELERE
ncbi:MAG: lytic transglycosylase domain-containing protein [Acidobacteria bacterium]|nr:lytic transglycosylase domain-containing protein [Acidobacteriota bacterium]